MLHAHDHVAVELSVLAITNVDMLLFSRDGKKGEEAVREYKSISIRD